MSGAQPAASALYLRPDRPKDEEHSSVGYQIREIVDRKGHLRTVTQVSLQADEQEQNGAGQGNEASGHDAEESAVEPGTLEHIRDSKQKMTELLAQAHNQSMFAVDFVSLLLSKYSPQGQRSMSVALKKDVPPGTIAYDEWPLDEQSDAMKATRSLAAQGQRLKGLTDAAESLLNAASRLQTDVKKETRYWEQVLSVTDAGWAVCRTSKRQHVLGVQLGFPEAGPLFRPRGFVPLDAENDGTLVLRQRGHARPKAIRVRVCEGSTVLGTSYLKAKMPLSSNIEERIRAARDSLFEEELFHELTIESQTLMGFGVKWRNASIHVPLQSLGLNVSTRRELMIDLVNQDFKDEQTPDSGANRQASQVALLIEVLLLNTYDQRLRRRAQPPQPLSEGRQSFPPADILRPLIIQDRHHVAIVQLREYLHTKERIFRNAKLGPAEVHLSVRTVRDKKFISGTGSKMPSNTSDSTYDFVSAMMHSCHTAVKMPLPSGKGVLDIDVHTQTSPQKPVLEYSLTLPSSMTLSLTGKATDSSPVKESSMRSSLKPIKQVFLSHEELVSYLDDVWALDIAHHVLAASQPGAKARDQEPEVHIQLAGSDGRPSEGVQLHVRLSSANLKIVWRKSHFKGRSGELIWDADERDPASLSETLERILDPRNAAPNKEGDQ